MEDFLFKLGFMTQKNYVDLLQMISTMQLNITEINRTVNDLKSQLTAIQNLNDKNLSAIVISMNTNQTEIINRVNSNNENILNLIEESAKNLASAQNERIGIIEKALENFSKDVAAYVEELTKTTRSANEILRSQLADIESAQNKKLSDLEKSLRADIEIISNSVEKSETIAVENNIATNKLLTEIKSELLVLEELLKLTSANQIMSNIMRE